MGQLEQDAAKRAAAGESLGAFLTFDMHRLDKAQLIMLGQREMLAKYMGIVNQGISNALRGGNIPLHTSLRELGAILKMDADAITEELGRSALRSRAATIQEIPKEPT